MQADPADPPDAGLRCKRLRSSSHEESRPPPPYPVKAAVARLLRQVFSSKEPVRDMDFVELFAGEVVASEGMRAFGYRGWTMDLQISLDHDFVIFDTSTDATFRF